MTSTNPLLQAFKTKHNTPPFNSIKAEHYKPAFLKCLEDAREEIKKIENNTSVASFENTIEALEYCGKQLDTVAEIFFNLNHANTSDELQKLAEEMSPLLTEFGNDIYLNDTIFNKVDYLYNSNDTLNLSVEQKMLLKNTYKAFIKNGAKLSTADKETFRDISKKLSILSVNFSQNVLAETNSFSLHITNKNDLGGLPEYVKEAAREQAKAENKDGWIFNLQFPSYVPFMQYANNRELRQKLFEAYTRRCNNANQHDNNKIVLQIANLRLQKANLLGYSDYASFVLEDRMASDNKTVFTFLNDLFEASLPVAQKEVLEVQQFAKDNGADFELQRWDWSYYSEKLKKHTFDLSDEMTKPYFELNSVTTAIFALAKTLYGIEFKQSADIMVYHEDVTAYEVFDADGKFLSVFYLDFHPRASKQGGAWMTSFSSQYKKEGTDFRPQVSLVCNFTKPTETTPSLLTFTEVETFLHEFGHGLHGMLTKCTYGSLSGTSVYRDFVELPSQIMENWATEKEWLNSFARHYKTNEIIPDELVNKIINSRNFLSGYQSLRQLSFGFNDMAWHSITEEYKGSVTEFEHAAMSKTELFPLVEKSLMSTAFSHIFSGGYAAGYYGYKWAEVLDADAFAVFKKTGIFNKKTADKFRTCILEKGGTEHPMDLYIQFKGEKPTVNALLERSGLKC